MGLAVLISTRWQKRGAADKDATGIWLSIALHRIPCAASSFPTRTMNSCPLTSRHLALCDSPYISFKQFESFKNGKFKQREENCHRKFKSSVN